MQPSPGVASIGSKIAKDVYTQVWRHELEAVLDDR